MQVDLITKHLWPVNIERVRVVGSHNRATKFSSKEKYNHLNNLGDIWENRQGNQGRNYQIDNYYDKSSYQDCEQGNWKSKGN